MLHNMHMQLLIISLFLFSLLTACGPSKKAIPEPQLAAALEFLTLSTKDNKNRNFYGLKAAEAYIKAGDYVAAQKALDDINVGDNDSFQNIRVKILSALLKMKFGQPKIALALSPDSC